MGENNPRLSAFEARLAQLRKKMEAGLGERAARIEAHLRQLSDKTQQAREGLRHEAHKLRGIAGTFGHVALGELAGALEQVALVAPSDRVAALAQQLVDTVQRAGITIPTLDEPSTQTVAPTQTRRVLAIDDDDETRKLLELTLNQLGGYTTVVAQNGTEGLARLFEAPFDVVLCDAMMPDMNGLTFCERARALQRATVLPPIVILSAATADELGWDVSVSHAPSAWWRKPFRPKELIAQIQSLLQTVTS